MTTNNHDRIDAIRKRRYDAVSESIQADIDWLLSENRRLADGLHGTQTALQDAVAEVERLQVSEQALTLRLTASLGAEREGDQEIVRLRAEVERLRTTLKTIFWMETCHMENMPEAGCPSCLAGDTLGDVLIEYGKQDLLQQLTDLDQSRYEEADNPLVRDVKDDDHSDSECKRDSAGDPQ